MGVLSSFSVAKKITDDEIQKYLETKKKKGKSEAEIENMVREKIINDIAQAMKENKIPGLMSAQNMAKQLGMDPSVIDNIPELNRLIMVVAQKMIDKGYDKMSLCYAINGIVNFLGLTETDFKKFHNKTKEDDKDDDFDDYDDEFGDDGPEDDPSKM